MLSVEQMANLELSFTHSPGVEDLRDLNMDDRTREQGKAASNRRAACSPPASNHRSIPPEAVTEPCSIPSEERVLNEGSCLELMIAEEQGASVSLQSMMNAAFETYKKRGHELENDMKLAKEDFEEQCRKYECRKNDSQTNDGIGSL